MHYIGTCNVLLHIGSTCGPKHQGEQTNYSSNKSRAHSKSKKIRPGVERKANCNQVNKSKSTSEMQAGNQKA